MKVHGLLLDRHVGGDERRHDGRIAVDERNRRWYGFEIGCDNGERVRVAFALDCCDREAMSFLATNQAMPFGRLLGTPPSTHLAGISHTTKFAEFFESIGRVPPQSRDAFLAWQLERYVVPQALWSEGAWLDDYLRRRIAAARTANDLVEAFVAIADPARLEEAWIGQAPRPVAEPHAPQDGLQRELDVLRKSQDSLLREIDALRKSRSWRLTAPCGPSHSRSTGSRSGFGISVDNVRRISKWNISFAKAGEK
jgi:hypothetical protein